MNDDIIDPIPPPEPIKRVESRLRAWWSAWKYVAILALLLILSIALNVHQYGTKRAAKAECKTLMVAAAKAGIEAERKRATEAERRAQKIAQDTKQDTARATSAAQESTNARQHRIEGVRTTGACRMPGGLPRLDPAVDQANAAAGD